VLYRIAPQLNVPIAELKNLPLAQQWDRIAELADQASGVGIVEIRRLAVACQAHLRALARYEPLPYPEPSVLFKAQGGGHHVPPARQCDSRDSCRAGLVGGQDRRWKTLCPKLCIEPVPGDHFSMLREPHVQVLAERLGRFLQESDGWHVSDPEKKTRP
jgi:thioesterase domain-containing protein